jgi:hypothetical protein
MGRPINLHKFGSVGTQVEQGDSYTTIYAEPHLEVKANLSGTANVSAGLIQQKKQSSFRVKDGSGHTAICTLVNKAPAACLTGEMSLLVTPAAGPTFYAKRITNRYVWNWNNVRYRWTFAGGAGIATVEQA